MDKEKLFDGERVGFTVDFNELNCEPKAFIGKQGTGKTTHLPIKSVKPLALAMGSVKNSN